ncbi:MAG TPA: type II secretion system major pseudopilin GspG [bacterium]|nr:type II secretion system major pseudopilin GspG [bacterium]
MFRSLKNSAGMSLVEIMIVIAIMGAIGALVATNILPMFEKSKVENTKNQMKNIEQALQLYYTDNSSYPTTEQGLEALATKPTAGTEPENYNPSGYMKKIPKDQWGKPFIYESDGTKYSIMSYGKDRKEGGDGYAEDIVIESE